jgi:GNAT superfamily N-acetyltransferase
MEINCETVRYRRAGISDIGTLIDYRVRFLNELDNHPEDEETKVLRKSLQDYFSGAIPSNSLIAWLAECDGRIVGTSGMVVWQIPARYGGLESGKAGYILNMYTIPEARGKGICTRLLHELIEEARSMGLTYLHLHATKDGIRIYRKAGFVEPDDPELKLTLKR